MKGLGVVGQPQTPVPFWIDRNENRLHRSRVRSKIIHDRATSASVVGQTSGQLVKPKNTNRYFPRNSAVVRMLPSLSASAKAGLKAEAAAALSSVAGHHRIAENATTAAVAAIQRMI